MLNAEVFKGQSYTCMCSISTCRLSVVIFEHVGYMTLVHRSSFIYPPACWFRVYWRLWYSWVVPKNNS